MNKVCIVADVTNITLVFDGSENARDPRRGNLLGITFTLPDSKCCAYAVETPYLSQGDWGAFTSNNAAVRWLMEGDPDDEE